MGKTFVPASAMSGAFDQVAGSSSSEPLSDVEKYLPKLAEYDLSEDAARELCAVLETIARGFVEYAWTGEVCGQFLEGFQAVLSIAVEPLKSENPDPEDKGDRSQ